MENLELNLEDLFAEIKDRALTEGAYSQEEWNDMVEEALEEKRAAEEMHDDEAWAEICESLKSRYEDFRLEVGEM